MAQSVNRRQFLGTAASTGLALGLTSPRAYGANERVVVGVVGTGGRGTELAREFSKLSQTEIAYVCDCDRGRAARAAAAVGRAGAGSAAPRDIQDFRRVLDDKAVDVIVVATCNHWHAPAAILACAAGKHVYVEKPCSHNPREGELMVEAARKYNRKVQMGTQRRSYPHYIEAVEQVRSGAAIGRAYFAQSWYTNNRPSIGKGEPGPVPEGLDYDLWQGPAPRRPFRTNYLHYNWHWFWHWGNGELGNNGVHTLDVCRWGLGVDFPVHVTSSGGRYRYQDDQETPDTNIVSLSFADRKTITWEGLSCSQLPASQQFDIVFVGEKGTLAITDRGYTIFDEKRKEVRKVPGRASESLHFANFLAAVRNEAPLNQEIESGHKTTLLCHLGNIAYRTGRALHCDPATGHIKDDAQAMTLWSREYEKGWEPHV